jgi:hypothetical protein
MSCLYRYIGAFLTRLLRLGHIVNKLSSKNHARTEWYKGEPVSVHVREVPVG